MALVKWAVPVMLVILASVEQPLGVPLASTAPHRARRAADGCHPGSDWEDGECELVGKWSLQWKEEVRCERGKPRPWRRCRI
jgi:hypothetical protein